MAARHSSSLHGNSDFPESEDSREELICIEYPGLVKNIEKVLETLRPEESATQEPFRSVCLKYRPQDPNCRGITGRRKHCSGFLLKCRRRKKRLERKQDKEGEEGDGSTQGHFEAEVIASVTSVVDFSEMCEYQVLHPGLQKRLDSAPVSKDSYEITRLLSGEDLLCSAPLFLPPPTAFTKVSYPMSPSVYEQSKGSHKVNHSFKEYRRPVLTSHTMTFDRRKEVPKVRPPESYPDHHPSVITLAKLFEEKPVWSRAGLEERCNMSEAQIKRFLASVAYHFTQGPWRLMWVKLGYDPRKDSTAKKYQSIDFRVPRYLGDSFFASSVGSDARPGPGPSLLGEGRGLSSPPDEPLLQNRAGARRKNQRLVFAADSIPSQRFSVYQLRDLHNDTLQSIVHSNDGREPTECHPVTGWCDSQAYDKLRTRMIDIFRKSLC